MPWGIDVPDDPDSVMYVWFEALLNYITAARRLELAELTELEGCVLTPKPLQLVNVIGKDILKFHGVLFPELLDRAHTRICQSMVCHEHWTYENVKIEFIKKKMSKSFGNVINPFEIIERLPLEAIRLYFLIRGPFSKDMNYSEEDLLRKYNSFVDTIGKPLFYNQSILTLEF